MCGIACCITRTHPVSDEKFENMVDIVSHRGPDGRGIYRDGNIFLGHRRLAIISPGDEGKQPFIYKDRYVLVYNGEIYNYKELRAELSQKGCQFHTHTDTEVLAAAFDSYGTSCVQKLNGMWAFAIFDKKERSLFCSRDRFGIKPFYYWYDQERILIASEIKQFFEIIEDRPKANKRRLLEFLVTGDMDYSDETMFEQVRQLPAGHNLSYTVSDHKLNICRYYNLADVRKDRMSYEDASSAFEKLFQKSVELRHRSDVPVGYCLSGGLDSSAIVCMADKLIKEGKSASQGAGMGANTEKLSEGDGSRYAVSSCFEDARYDEREYIDAVVEKTGIHSYRVFPKVNTLFDTVDKIIWHMDEPFGSTSIFAQWNVFQCAGKHGLTVMLDGQGADEQLAGYSGFYSVLFADYLKKLHPCRLLKEVSQYKRRRAKTEPHVSSVVILAPAFLSVIFPEKLLNRVKCGFYSHKGTPFDKETVVGILNSRAIYPVSNEKKYILDSIRYGMASLLHYEDRNSMAHSIESRVPFLDYQLVEFLYSLPLSYKLRGGVTKSLMRDALKEVLPAKIYKRISKLGFVTPEDQWINDNREIFREELQSASQRLEPLINTEAVMKWFDGKEKMDRGDFQSWRIICAGRWMKVFHVSLD